MKFKKKTSILEISLLIIASISFAYFTGIEMVSGSKDANVCCEKTNNGRFCQGVTQDECSGNFVSSPCFETSFCRFGCCVDEERGIYADASQANCNKKFVDKSCQNIPEAKKGCCIIGERGLWSTEKECDWRAGNLEWRFDSNIDRVSCSLLKNENMGACVSGEMCRFVTGKNCQNLRGVFYEGYLCTAPELNTSCKMTDKTRCFSGLDEVYFADSCGNRANIYDSSKIKDITYWTRVINKEDSCSLNLNNNQKQCGNCNRFASSICSSALQTGFNPSYGDYYCKDNSCKFERKTYQNGESWCVYEGKIGDGDDVPGSVHWRYVCNQGEIDVKACSNDRSQICVHADMLDNNNQTIFSRGICRMNDYRDCINYNSLPAEEKIIKCEENVDCDWRGFRLSEHTTIGFCAPSYPRGWLLSNEEKIQDAINTCNIATQTCTIIYVKGIDLKYHCAGNCECEKEGFTQQMNEWCRSLGDCGMSVNFAGDLSDEGYDVGGKAPAISSASYINALIAKANNVEGQKAELGIDLKTIAEYAGISVRDISDVSIHESRMTYLRITLLLTGPFGWISLAFLEVLRLTPLRGITEEVERFIGNILKKWFGIGKIKRKYATFTCKPWMPEAGGDCEKCNDDLMLCNAYRCQSLGQACELVNIGSSQEKCASKINDGKPPIISPLYGFISENEKYVEKTNGFEIKPLQGECINAYTKLQFGIETNEIATCRYSNKISEWENMSDFGSNLALNEHKFEYVVLDPAGLNSLGLNYQEDFNLYLKCRDVHGNEYPSFYNIEFCVNDAPDKFLPEISEFFPDTNSLIGIGVNSVNASIFTNEPAECRWSEQNTIYEFMPNQLNCFDYTEIEEIDEIAPTINGYECFAELPVTENENKFYFACKDQPWVENAGRGDERLESRTYEYILRRVSQKLNIESIIPFEDFESETSPTELVVQAKTSGGGDSHVCEQKVDKFSWDEMMNSGNVHSYTLRLYPGVHKLFVRCRDETGGSAEGEVEFEIIHDNLPPEIARIFQKDRQLIVITDEESECRYSDKADFGFEEGKSMGTGLRHSADISGTVYIKCKDEFENMHSQAIEIELLR